MPAVTNLGHLGLFCQDVEKMRDFYSRFMGMTITDEDPEWGICFLSANPEQEHHELALARMRPNGETTQYLQQVSFIVDSMEDLQTFYHRLQDEGLKIDRTVTHGISCSIYFFDPEDNRVELYYKTGYNVRQPLGEHIDLDQPADDLLAFSKSFEVSKGPSVGESTQPGLWNAPV